MGMPRVRAGCAIGALRVAIGCELSYCSDSRERDLQTYLYPIRHDAGKAVSCVLTGQDTTGSECCCYWTTTTTAITAGSPDMPCRPDGRWKTPIRWCAAFPKGGP